MLQMEEGLAHGGQLADDCVTEKVYHRRNLESVPLDANLARLKLHWYYCVMLFINTKK